MPFAITHQKALSVLRKQGGVFRSGQALALGIPSSALAALQRTGRVQRLARGVYQLTEVPPLSEPDLVSVAMRIPRGVICLISALAFHDLTAEVPHAVDVAVLRGTEPPRLDTPPVRSYQISEPAFSAGVETHLVDRVPVRIYAPEKTIADCFKFRNKIGLEVALDALKRWSTMKNASPAKLLHYARICRVEQVLRPYLEALV
jgi:predicted transcriptional regulator of viral defense system